MSEERKIKKRAINIRGMAEGFAKEKIIFIDWM